MLFFNTNISGSIIKSFVNRWEINSLFLCNQLIASPPSSVGIKVYKLELSKGISVGNFLKKIPITLNLDVEVLIKFQSSYLIVVLDFLDHQILVSLFKWSRQWTYMQNFQCLLCFLLSPIYVPLVDNKINHLRIWNLLDNLFVNIDLYFFTCSFKFLKFLWRR